MERRIRLIFTIPQYKSSELVLIFNKMIIDDKWELADSILLNTKNNELLTFINKNKNNFKFCGGDMQALLQNCRDAHSTRVIGKHPKFKKIITMDDIYKGYDLFIKNMDRNQYGLRRFYSTLCWSYRQLILRWSWDFLVRRLTSQSGTPRAFIWVE